MDSVALIVTALSAGAGSAIEDGAATALKTAYGTLRKKVEALLKDQPLGETVLTEYAKDPGTWERPLARALEVGGAGEDAQLITAARLVLELLNDSASRPGVYFTDVRDSRGIQIGSGNIQYIDFDAPEPEDAPEADEECALDRDPEE
jgi:hypothetical protein